MTKSPIVGKGTSFPFQVSVACWIDLLGYGRMISEAGFNPLHPKAKDAIKRIRRFHCRSQRSSLSHSRHERRRSCGMSGGAKTLGRMISRASAGHSSLAGV
ncbi:hypothetical protein [Hyphomicrobium sp. CS1GBMeth3]|uniref:hypothetical protein n=1 Tax=Hyphomicrobium sp. CS1GBMeth3 TaxID=1892845 RepID=UPI0015C52B1A|nr:hypothetical protein [Hyphomicrobium sp. CS1GBMeth3]